MARKKAALRMKDKIDEFIEKQIKRGKRGNIPARLQAAIALLEKLRVKPALRLEDHLASPGSAGLKSHETYGDRAHERLQLEPINKNHGRRSSDLGNWGPNLLDLVKLAGFLEKSQGERNKLIDEIQFMLSRPLRSILEEEPLEARGRGRSAEHVIGDVLDQAEEKGKSGELAQYIVGAKLRLKFNAYIPPLPYNKGDRKSRSDPDARSGDFQMEDAVIEVALGLPDEKHVSQVVDVLEETDLEIWLLTRAERVETWKKELKRIIGAEMKRVVVDSVEGFVGQNVTELGRFSSKGKTENLVALFDIYNKHWVESVGPPGIRIVMK